MAYKLPVFSDGVGANVKGPYVWHCFAAVLQTMFEQLYRQRVPGTIPDAN